MVDIAPAPAVQPVNTNGAPISQAGGTPVPQGNNALLVTSSNARAVTSDNVSKLNTVTAGLIPQQSDAQRSAAMDAAGLSDTAKNNVVTGKQDTTTGADGGTGSAGSSTASTDPNADAVKGIKDPALAAQYKGALDNLDGQAADAKAQIQAAKDTLANDPAASAAIDAITQKYDVLINAMKAKNAQVLGKASTSVSAFGGLGQMSQNFLSAEQDRASQRVADLVSQEQGLILKAQIAYKNSDVKALNAAMTAYDRANSDKLSAINKLLTETDKQVKAVQDQQKIDAAAAKQQVATDISKSTNLGTGIAKNIADSGITDQEQIDQYIASVAQEYGISNADILKNAVAKAQAAAAKDALSAKNTESIINKRNQPKAPSSKTTGGGKDGGYTYTGDDVSAYTSLLNKGGTGPDGTVYAGRGKDSYVDPGAYMAALHDWVDVNNGTPAGFAKKFPVVGNVNPASYSSLPEGIRPKASSTASTYKTTN